MPQSKVTFVLHDNFGGFSESFIDNANAAVGYPTINLSSYLTARMKCSGKETLWDYIRVSDLDPTKKRKVLVFAPGDADPNIASIPLSGLYAQTRLGNPVSADFVDTRFLIRFTNADLSFTRQFFGGLPDNQVDQGGEYVPTGQFPTLFGALVDTISANVWGWKNSGGQVANSPTPLTNAVQNADGTITFTTVPVAPLGPIFATVPLASKQRITIRDQVSPANLNGRYLVKVLTGTTCQTIRKVAFNSFLLGVGVMQLNNPTGFKAINRGKIERVTRRLGGRLFAAIRGRSKNRLLG
jgi:hypothetical protein